MNRLIATSVAAVVLVLVAPVFAAETNMNDMSKHQMDKGTMKKDEMKSDTMKNKHHYKTKGENTKSGAMGSTHCQDSDCH